MALLLGIVVALFAGPKPARARELSWPAIDVRARLDADGALHVVERQTMLFTGDWNGGERVFRVEPGQDLRFESIRRIGADGSAHALTRGDLSEVDQYAWKDRRTLRWRSRKPSDPAFENTELVYELSYTYSRILLKEGSRYVLDHDFLFPDRTGPVEKFSLAIDLDPAWRPASPLPPTFARANVEPGEGFVVHAALDRVAAGTPGAVRRVVGRAARGALLLLLGAAAVLLWLRWRSREEALGRFAPLRSPDAVDAAWLKANVFSLSPEEAGALWDGSIGAPEVTAVLARLAADKKIASEAQGKKLTMRLLVPRGSFHGYEGALISGLFFGNRTETDTDAVKQHYRSSGFDPASKIKPGLETKLAAHPDFQDKSARPPVGPALWLLLAGIAALVLSVVVAGEQPGTAIASGISYAFLAGIGALCAVAVSRRSDRSELASLGFLWLPALLLVLAFWGWSATDSVTPYRVAGVFLLRLSLLVLVFRLAATRDGPKKIARRKALAAGRAFFARELGKPAPALEDAWFPWIVAFGLAGRADRWFRAHGGAAAASSGFGSSSSSGSSTASSSWSGGGGAFGGGGASASWAAAAAGLAAGVSAPSSSGGGGGGGGGSSGGGGGGGW
ncbi:MAG TPA: hypothetical protein VIA45_09300 [Thermoanaerobaculia bacterium]|jgi:uncharacterized membrane protein YgcG